MASFEFANAADILTLEMLKEMEPGVFTAGVGMDGPREIRWVATRGDIHDWAIYMGLLDWSTERIKNSGDKMFTAGKIKSLVPCTDEAFAMYRI